MAEFVLLPRTEIAPLAHLVDAYLDTSHRLAVSKTTHPVEGGSAVTDHAVTEPAALSLTGFVGNLVSADRSANAWQQVRALADAKERLTVITSWWTYHNMLVTGARTSRNRGTGGALIFNLDLEELLIVGQDATAVSGPAADRPGTVYRGLRHLRPDTGAISAVDDMTGRSALLNAVETAGDRLGRTRDLLRTGIRQGQELNRVIGVGTSGNTRSILRETINVTPGLSDDLRSGLREALTASLDISDDTDQLFRTVVGGDSRDVRVWRQPVDGQWYLSASGVTAGARLQPGQSVGGSDFRVMAPEGAQGMGEDPWSSGYRVGWEGPGA